ncbi:helix-turn-helix domain-containing protein [Yersinia aleksiciae]|uniref:Putative DNA-binding protein n=1 Tax=Yersinia aleksiciae TaxID=263819 RepID=A0A0T9T6R2_YERAE|nr:helix-turn-helix domain-containing protein [Yersinia aleksiciae]CNK64912.1 putative DNA-binding protein [Yersinia aleksiciae]
MKNDWHPAEIIAAIRKKGSTLGNALSRRWPKGEKIIADYLGVDASVIWPSRYKDKNKGTKY